MVNGAKVLLRGTPRPPSDRRVMEDRGEQEHQVNRLLLPMKRSERTVQEGQKTKDCRGKSAEAKDRLVPQVNSFFQIQQLCRSTERERGGEREEERGREGEGGREGGMGLRGTRERME